MLNFNILRFLFSISFFSLFISCSSVKHIAISSDLNRLVAKSEVLSSEFVGLCVYDPYEDAFLSEINTGKYFTPASNVKIITYYISSNKYPDQVPTFAYASYNGKTLLYPLGDPTFLNPDFPDQPVFDHISNIESDTLYIQYPNFELPKFAPGWAWDDYLHSFQPERAKFPIYGNTVNFTKTNDSVLVKPDLFADFNQILR